MSRKTDPRTALLVAGEHLAPRCELADLTPALLATKAGIDGAGFGAEFAGMDDYLVALQQLFMTELRDLVVQAAATRTGAARLREGGAAYLDECLRQHALRRWFVQARKQRVAVAAGLQKQDQSYMMILGLEFKALQWGEPQMAARQFLSTLQEIAQEEHEAGHELPQARERLWDFLLNPNAAAA